MRIIVTYTIEFEDTDIETAEEAVDAHSLELPKGWELTNTEVDEGDGYQLEEEGALADFAENILPGLNKAYGSDDAVARREAWNNYTDALCKDRTITTWQYENWDNPF